MRPLVGSGAHRDDGRCDPRRALGIGTVLGGYAILTREMSGAYRATRPASASIEIEGDVEDALRA